MSANKSTGGIATLFVAGVQVLCRRSPSVSRRSKCTTLHQNKSWQHAPFKMSHGTGTGGGSRTGGVKNPMRKKWRSLGDSNPCFRREELALADSRCDRMSVQFKYSTIDSLSLHVPGHRMPGARFRYVVTQCGAVKKKRPPTRRPFPATMKKSRSSRLLSVRTRRD
jgi:hypothetical protein